MIFLFYPFLSLVYTFLIYKKPLKLDAYLIILIFISSVFFGFRSNSDPDFHEYVYFIKLAKGLGFSNYLKNIYVEPLFFIASYFFESWTFFLFSFLSFSLLYFALRNLNYDVSRLSYIACLSSISFVVFFIQIRWGLALSFILAGFLSKRKFSQVMFYAFSILTHFFSIVPILIFIICKKIDISKKIYLLVILLVVCYFSSPTTLLLKIIYDLGIFHGYLSYKLDAYMHLFKNKEYFFYMYAVKYIFSWYIFRFNRSELDIVKKAYPLFVMVFLVFIDVGVFAQRISTLIEVLFSILIVDSFYRERLFNSRLLFYCVSFFYISLNWAFNISILFYKNYISDYHWIIS